ncbi:DUF4880 domain-containing protein [Azomonas macrocytogenes]|uniref:Transmembrane sensor n=1 Tax=Azomonas macrocytogenes TaxID=69962 RepID=A0A839T1U1_AZOMA|nr:DUF4880 domain-containing protein [Azomonas macrocytogenes]MBB3101713.1 transmembrane sensor [Azomonas macrocytogenes]
MSPLPAAIEQAIEWHARRSSGAFDTVDQQRFQRWLEADPGHGEAWNSLQQRLQQRLSPLSGPATRQALQAPRTSRRSLLRGALALGGMATCAHLLSRPGMPLSGWNADFRTATAERQHLVLADGSRLLLNAETAIDVELSETMRSVTLIEGSLIAEAPAQERPFRLACRYGEARLSAGRCLLEIRDKAAHLWMLEGESTLYSLGEDVQLMAGQGAQLDANGLHILPASPVDPAAWSRGLLEVHDQSLKTVIERLRPYHPGVLQVAENAAELRISGVFNLDDSEKALQALADILPLRIARYLGWWTRIEHA